MTVFSAFKTLDQIAAADELHAGGKAANCARLKQAGFAVPAGLVIPATATEADIHRLDDDPWMIGQLPGTQFAVRSSGIGEDGAGHSFAGVHETFLNVERERVRDAVLACRRSVHSAQAIAYRETRQIAESEASSGVLIQVMVPAATSGVAFTVNPVTGANELVINAAPGLGDALVSGQINPDEFRVSRSDGRILSSRVGGNGGPDAAIASIGKPALQELSALVLRIERHFGRPQDVEWCHDGRQFWVLQSRPVTTAPAPGPSPLIDVEWTRANLAEVFPDQLSPQTLAAYEHLLSRGQQQFMGGLLAPELGPMVRSFYGRLYFNLSQLRHVCRIGGVAPASALRWLGHSDAIQPADEVPVRAPLGQVLRCLPDLLRLVRNDLRSGRLMARQERNVEAVVQSFAAPRLAELDDQAIWAAIEAWRSSGPEYMQLVLTLASVLFDEDILRSACKRVGYPYDALVSPQLAAGERSISAQQAFDLVGLADVARRDAAVVRYFLETDGAFADFREALRGTPFIAEFDRFLVRYGHRGHYESDWALPRYREEPAPLLFAIKSHLARERPDDLLALRDRIERAAAEAWGAFHARATPWQRLTLLPLVRATLRRVKRRFVMREKCRSDLTRVVWELRRWHLELAERFVARGWLARRDDYFLLHMDEIARVVGDPASAPQLRDIVARRDKQRAEEQRVRMPLLMRESELAGALRRAHVTVTDASRLTGFCVSAGCVEGEVVVIRDPRDFQRMTRGAILVAPATDPSWTPLFTLASGVIVEVGGMLSHASTVAREYGLPALANVKDATRLLRTGDRVRLDATRGVVERSP